MFKNFKDIEFERICLITISLTLGFLYVAFRMLIGILSLAITVAVFLNHFLKGDSSFLSYFLQALTDIRIIFFGCMIGLGLWFSDM